MMNPLFVIRLMCNVQTPSLLLAFLVAPEPKGKKRKGKLKKDAGWSIWLWSFFC